MSNRPYFGCVTPLQGLLTNEFRHLCDIGARRFIDEDRIEAFSGVICHITDKTNMAFVTESIGVALAHNRPVALVVEEAMSVPPSLKSFESFSSMRGAAAYLVQTVQAIQTEQRQRTTLTPA